MTPVPTERRTDPTTSAGALSEPSDADLAARVATLDLATEVGLLTGASAFSLRGEPSVGLHAMNFSDGPTGVRGLKFTGGRTVALFPNATLLASAWSEDTADEVGAILAEEALSQEIHVVLGPTINLHRSALGGRLFEAYSEDPLLTGRLAAAYVRGLQRAGIGACLKHLVANESETLRHSVNCVVDEATLREVYLLPFEIAVAESDPWSMMAAYNDVNGVPATEQHHVNTEVLKREWGWTGLVMSDWFATKSAGPAAAGGLDLVMPGPQGPWGDALVAAVRSGEVEESVVDDHVVRLLRLAARTGALDGARVFPTGLPGPTSEVRREQLTRLAAQGMTVLTNRSGADGTAVLPLAPGVRVALVGRHAVETVGMGGGSAQVNAPYEVSLAEALTGRLGDGVTVADGVEVRTRPVPARPGFVTDPRTGGRGVRALRYTADGTVVDDSVVLGPTMVGFDDDPATPVARLRFEARVAAAGPVEIGGMGAGSWTLTVDGVEHRFAVDTRGEVEGATTLAGVTLSAADIVEGSTVMRPPAAVRRLDTNGPVDVVAEVSVGAAIGQYGFVARPAARAADAAIADAVAAARQADVAVVVVGLTPEQETESVDKTTLALPGEQDALVRAVAAGAARTVVVVNAATPVLMPWLDEVDAVLWAGLPGQEAGHAMAAVLLGALEPAGRLVTTFPAADGAAPAWSVTPDEARRLEYTEGPFLGYRGHAAGRAPAPAFWFGHGLGYATWEYGEATVAGGPGALTVTVPVTNTGSRTSREVVQVYLRPDPAVAATQPVRLAGWAAATVAAGATAAVEVALDDRLWRVWDVAANTWGRLPGGGTLVVARGLGDVRAELPLA